MSYALVLCDLGSMLAGSFVSEHFISEASEICYVTL
jgi:hypothetical protein